MEVMNDVFSKDESYEYDNDPLDQTGDPFSLDERTDDQLDQRGDPCGRYCRANKDCGGECPICLKRICVAWEF